MWEKWLSEGFSKFFSLSCNACPVVYINLLYLHRASPLGTNAHQQARDRRSCAESVGGLFESRLTALQFVREVHHSSSGLICQKLSNPGHRIASQRLFALYTIELLKIGHHQLTQSAIKGSRNRKPTKLDLPIAPQYPSRLCKASRWSSS